MHLIELFFANEGKLWITIGLLPKTKIFNTLKITMSQVSFKYLKDCTRIIPCDIEYICSKLLHQFLIMAVKTQYLVSYCSLCEIASNISFIRKISV